MAKTIQSLAKVNINSPQSLASFATVLKKFIVERNLYTEIQSKNYVNVEGWEFAGASIGVYPIVRETVDLSSSGEIKYKARVELVVLTSGKIMGAGEAVCSSKERSKGNFEEYAILSMAQTRAIGKAYRNAFAWLMKMAGYEATPAEEALRENVDVVPEVLTVDLDIVKSRVTAKLDTMSSADRIRTLKETGHTSPKQLTEANWRFLDSELGTDKPQKKVQKSGKNAADNI